MRVPQTQSVWSPKMPWSRYRVGKGPLGAGAFGPRALSVGSTTWMGTVRIRAWEKKVHWSKAIKHYILSS